MIETSHDLGPKLVFNELSVARNLVEKSGKNLFGRDLIDRVSVGNLEKTIECSKFNNTNIVPVSIIETAGETQAVGIRVLLFQL